MSYISLDDLEIWVMNFRDELELLLEEESPTKKTLADNQETIVDMLCDIVVQLRIVNERVNQLAKRLKLLDKMDELNDIAEKLTTTNKETPSDLYT